MQKFFLYVVVSMVSFVNATESAPQKEVSSNSNASEGEKETGGVTQVIEVIAEAAVRNRDYGKDIGDR